MILCAAHYQLNLWVLSINAETAKNKLLSMFSIFVPFTMGVTRFWGVPLGLNSFKATSMVQKQFPDKGLSDMNDIHKSQDVTIQNE